MDEEKVKPSTSYADDVEDCPSNKSKKRKTCKTKQPPLKLTSDLFASKSDKTLNVSKTKIQKSSKSKNVKVETKESEAGDAESEKVKRNQQECPKSNANQNTDKITYELIDEKPAEFHLPVDLVLLASEEIALEGLEGITLESLWVRLSAAIDHPFSFSIEFENFIWDSISMMDEMSFYKLPHPRRKVILYDRFSFVDAETGHILESENPNTSIYPFVPISDKNKGIVGSCSTYNERVDITNFVRNFSLKDVMESYGNNLVVVASQRLRFNALIPDTTNPLNDINDIAYYFLEQIGRSRTGGEVTCGSQQLTTICKDLKTAFYFRKSLLKQNLIFKQPICFKTKSKLNTSANLLHLQRFYNERKSRKHLLIEKIVNILKLRPQHRMEYMELRKVLGEENWEKLGISKLIKSQEFRHFVRTDLNLLYRDIYPNAKVSEWKKKSTGHEKVIRVFELINPNVNLNILSKDDEPGESSSDEEPVGDFSYSSPISKQIYDAILKSGKNGMLVKQMHRLIGCDYYTVRAIIKVLLKRKLIICSMYDSGRQRYTSYYASCYDSEEIFKKGIDVPGNSQEPDCEASEKESDALDFVANILSIDSSSLKRPKKMFSKMETNNITEINGMYNAIKNIRLKGLEIKDKYRGQPISQEDEEVKEKSVQKKLAQQIYSNGHGYIKNQTSFENGLIQRYGTFVPCSNHDLEVIVADMFEPPIEKAVYKCFDNMQIKKYYFEKIPKKPKKVIKQINTFGKYLYKLYSKPPYKYSQSYRAFIDKVKKLQKAIKCDLDNNQQVPKEIFSSEEDNDDNEANYSLFVNTEIGRDELVKSVKNVSNEVKNIILENFHKTEKISINFEHCVDTDIRLNETDRKRSADLEMAQESKRFKLTTEAVDGGQKIETPETPVSNKLACTSESFMGPNPILFYHNVDDDNVETKVFISSNPADFSCIKPLTSSTRILSRSQFVKDVVEQHKIITDTSKLLQWLIKSERKEGYAVNVDRKSLARIYTQLVREKVIQMIKIIVRYENVLRTKILIIQNGLSIDTFLQPIIDQFKLSFVLYAKRKEGSEEKPKEESEASVEKPEKPIYRYSRTVGKHYGYYPKIAKMRVLHEFLYFLTYENNLPAVSQEDVGVVLRQHCDKVDDSLINECSALYQREVSWKMFIPPLPQHKTWTNGWLLICDALLRLPLSILVKIFNISYIIPELTRNYLSHPIRKHFLVKNIPTNIRNAILGYRKYIFSIYEIFCQLCYMGLLQFGPQKFREKDQQFVYINKNAILFDTSPSEPGYHNISEMEYVKHHYFFNSSKDVEKYWSDVHTFSMNTKLGQRATVLGKYITLENIHSKPEMLQTLKPQTPESVLINDVGYLPGDGLGACRTDSALWLHVKRNWVWANKRNKAITGSEQYSIRGVRKKALDLIKQIKIEECLRPNSKNKNKIKTLNRVQLIKRKTCKKKKSDRKQKAILRNVKPRKPTAKRVAIDSIDKGILAKMGKTRSIFSKDEDNIILLCKAVIEYLFPLPKKRMVVYTTMRDFIHRILPNSRKTSQAYKRRLFQLKKLENVQDEKHLFDMKLSADYFTQKHFKLTRDKMVDVDTPISEMEISLAFLHLAYFTFKQWKSRPQSNTGIDCNDVKDYLTSDNIDKYKIFKVDGDDIYYDPECEDDICMDTIKSVIISSLGCQNANQEWPYQLLKVYQSFSENLLRTSLNLLRDQQLISGKKATTKHSGGKEGAVLVRGTSYHLSFSFTFKQITKYPIYIFSEANEFMMWLNKHIESITSAGQSIEGFDQGHGLALSEIALFNKINYEFDLPDDMVTLDPDVHDHTDLVKELALRYNTLMSKKNVDNDVDENASADPNLGSSLEEMLGTFIKAQDKTEKETIDDQISFDLLKMFDKFINPTTKSDTTTINVQNDSIQINTDRRQKGLRIFDLAFLLTKGLFPELDDDDRLEKLNKQFLVKYPTCKFYVEDNTNIDALNHMCHEVVLQRTKDVLNRIKKKCIISNTMPTNEEIREYLDNLAVSDCEKKAVDKISNFIFLKNMHGATSEELHEFHQTLACNVPLDNILQLLIDVGLVIRVGVTTFSFVHYNYRHNWTIFLDTTACVELQLKGVGYRAKISPWVKIDGTLHMSLLHNWLNIALSHALSYPVIPFMALCKRFCYIKPVDIFYLLEILQELTCIHLYKFNKTESTDLFSDLVEIEKCPATFTDDFQNIFVEVDQFAILKFGAFMDRDKTDFATPF